MNQNNIVAQKALVERREIRDASRLSRNSPVEGKVRSTVKQLTLWELLQAPEAKLFRQKPQIASIPGVSLKEQRRYRVILGSRILGDRLTLEQAIDLAKLRGAK